MSELINPIRVLTGNQRTIIKYWLENESLCTLLHKKQIIIKDFLRNYALPLLNYYIRALKEETLYINKEFSSKLIEFFREKDLNAGEVFSIYNDIKKAILDVLYINNIDSYIVFKRINFIFEKNISFILVSYTKNNTNNLKKMEPEDFELEHAKNIEIIDKNILLCKLDKNFKFTYVSSAYCDLSLYSKDELLGNMYDFLKYSKKEDILYKELITVLKKGKKHQTELKCRKKDGTFYYLNVYIVPLINEKGLLLSYEIIEHDISLEKALEEQQEMFIEQSKSAAVGEMISMIAHQWRQPLQAISILIQKLPLTKMMDGEIPDDVLDQVVSDSNMQLEYMSKTIDDFRDFLKPNIKKESIIVKNLVLKVKDFLSYMLTLDSIELIIHNDDENAQMTIHVNEVVQVLINIVKNAQDALLSNKKDKREITIHSCVQNNYVIIKIQDNAGGIDDKVIKKIFDAYFSTKDDKNGTGLGLLMSKKIIEDRNKGFLTAYNNEDGAVFEIQLEESNN